MNGISQIEKEKHLIETMITLYCRKRHNGETLCNQCKALLEYSHKRLDNCRYKENKHFCSKCPTPCYGKTQRVQIKQVMKFSGPRMLIYNPKTVIRHIFQTKSQRRL